MTNKVISIALPETLKDYVEKRMSNKGYGNVSEYFRDLIRTDQERETEERLDALLLQGLNSGERIEVTPEYVKNKLERLITKHTKK